jgi:hypothetical protein
MRWPVLLLVAGTTCVTGCFALTKYAVDRPGLECDRALRVARRTLDTLGYTITEMVQPKERVPGSIAGTRTLPSGKVTTGRVRIVCNAGGAELQPIEDSIVPDYEFSRAFGYSFKSLVQSPDVESPVVQSGVQVLAEVLDVYEQRLDLGSEAVGRQHALVRLTVRNGTDRAVMLEASGLTLVTADGASAEPLADPVASGAVLPGAGGDRVRRELVDRLEVPARSTAVRFLIYQAGAYREARVDVEDVETKEHDGFVTPVQ